MKNFFILKNIRFLASILIGVALSGCKGENPNRAECLNLIGSPKEDSGYGLPESNLIPASSYYGIDVNPENPTEIVSGKWIWDSTGTQILREGFVKINLQTEEETWLFEEDNVLNSTPRWSSKDWIVFGTGQLFLIKSDGDSLRILQDSTTGYYYPIWSPKGDKLLCWGGGAKNTMLWVLGLQGNKERSQIRPHSRLYYMIGDWGEDSLIVSRNNDTPPGAERRGQDLTFLSYPELTPTKRIQVLGTVAPGGGKVSIDDVEWVKGTHKVMWVAGGVMYETDYDTGKSRVVYDNCERRISEFSLIPGQHRAVCRISELTFRDDMQQHELSYHLYEINFADGSDIRLR